MVAKRIASLDILKTNDAFPGDPSAFLSLKRLLLVNRYDDGTASAPYSYDVVTRNALDAVVLVLTGIHHGRPSVCLRSCLRPPLLLRRSLDLPQPDNTDRVALLELPAGLIEADDWGLEGLLERASREALEETGYRIPPHGFDIMGSSPFVSPGAIPERIFYVRAEVSDTRCAIPPAGDGTPTEEAGEVLWIPVDDAVKMCEQGEIVDMKTELGLRRLVSG